MGTKDDDSKVVVLSADKYKPICYHCLSLSKPDANQMKSYFRIDPSRLVQQCVVCKRQTIEGLSVKESFLKVYYNN